MDTQLMVLVGKVLLGLAAAAALWFGFRPFAVGGTGWGGFARRFRVTDLPHGKRFDSVSGALGDGLVSAKYQRMWTLVLSDSGFGLSILSVFGKAPAIFVPWIEVESVVETQLLFITAAVIRIRGQAQPILVYGPPGAALASSYAQLHAARSL